MMVISDIDFERVSKIGGDGDRERFGNSVVLVSLHISRGEFLPPSGTT